MRISPHRTTDKVIWALTVFILTSYVLFETYTWGRYAYFGASALVVLLTALGNQGRFTVKLQAFHGFVLLFSGFCFASALWGIDTASPVQMGKTVFQIGLCLAMLYIHYQNQPNVEKLLDVVKWAGYIVAIYAIVFYGLDAILDAAAGNRLSNAFSNVNTIGMASATACVIQTHQWLYKEKRKAAVFMIPCVVVIAASQSRKALVLLVVGVVAVYLLKQRRTTGLIKKLLQPLLLLLAAGIMGIILYNLPIFDGVRERMDSMLAGFFGKGKVDNSALLRMNMTALGFEWFLKYPIGGVGVGNPHILSGLYLGADTYLHNNFAELLCGGGIFGFVIYYSMYVYLFWNLLKYRNRNRKQFEICVVWLSLMLIMNYGMVTYYAKAQWFYLMVHFSNINSLKKLGGGRECDLRN